MHGKSLVSVAPDEVEIDVGIVSEGSTAEGVSAQNTTAVSRLLESLRSILPIENINTVNLSIDPNFRYPKEGAPVIQGYTGTNTVRVTLNKLDLLPLVITAATKAGASSINRLNFTLCPDTERQARARALGEAASQAAAGASALASSLKLKLGVATRRRSAAVSFSRSADRPGQSTKCGNDADIAWVHTHTHTRECQS